MANFVLLDCVQKRYPDHDHRKLMATLSQKCRDAGRLAADGMELVTAGSE